MVFMSVFKQRKFYFSCDLRKLCWHIVQLLLQIRYWFQILYNEQSKIYLLRNVKRNARYEVRVSYPAVVWKFQNYYLTYFTFFPAPSLIYNEWVCFIYETYKENLQSLEKACRLHTKKMFEVGFSVQIVYILISKETLSIV